jgi:Ca2+-binding RTX toxin-like protein
VLGGAGNDVIGFLECDCGGDSNDRIAGGSGVDTLEYSIDPNWQFAVTVDLAAGSAEGEAINSDFIASIENIVGTESADELAGDDRANQVVGGIGDAALFGRGGDDLLDGGDGADSVDGGEGLDSCLNGEKQTACES